jgi:hypothetical protein
MPEEFLAATGYWLAGCLNGYSNDDYTQRKRPAGAIVQKARLLDAGIVSCRFCLRLNHDLYSIVSIGWQVI